MTFVTRTIPRDDLRSLAVVHLLPVLLLLPVPLPQNLPHMWGNWDGAIPKAQTSPGTVSLLGRCPTRCPEG